MNKKLREHCVIGAAEPYKSVLLTQDKEMLEKYEKERLFFDIEVTVYEDMRDCVRYEDRPFSLAEIINRIKEDMPSVYFKNHDFHIIELTVKRQISQDRFKLEIKVFENVNTDVKCCECGKIQEVNERFMCNATGTKGNYTYIFNCDPCFEKGSYLSRLMDLNRSDLRGMMDSKEKERDGDCTQEVPQINK